MTHPAPHQPQPYPPPSGPPAHPQLPPGYQVVMMPAQRTSGAATGALVLGILGALLGWCFLGLPNVAAVILGHVGRRQTADGTVLGRGRATAGLILGYVFAAPWLYLGFHFMLAQLSGAGQV